LCPWQGTEMEVIPDNVNDAMGYDATLSGTNQFWGSRGGQSSEDPAPWSNNEVDRPRPGRHLLGRPRWRVCESAAPLGGCAWPHARRQRCPLRSVRADVRVLPAADDGERDVRWRRDGLLVTPPGEVADCTQMARAGLARDLESRHGIRARVDITRGGVLVSERNPGERDRTAAGPRSGAPRRRRRWYSRLPQCRTHSHRSPTSHSFPPRSTHTHT
jgi:hypothetical protein